mgnify:CR=1 FL=1
MTRHNNGGSATAASHEMDSSQAQLPAVTLPSPDAEPAEAWRSDFADGVDLAEPRGDAMPLLRAMTIVPDLPDDTGGVP